MRTNSWYASSYLCSVAVPATNVAQRLQPDNRAYSCTEVAVIGTSFIHYNPSLYNSSFPLPVFFFFPFLAFFFFVVVFFLLFFPPPVFPPF